MSASARFSIAPALFGRFSRFLGVGACGFLVDASLFFSLNQIAHWHYALCKVVSIVAGITTTFALNRRFTFSHARQGEIARQYVHYFGASLLGAGANLAVLSAIAPFDAPFAHVPGYLAGTAAGLVANFLLYDRVVFAQRA